MPKIIDLTGKRFSKLVALFKDGKGSDGEIMWKCQCDCGEFKTVRNRALRDGRTTSCGCYNREQAYKRAIENRPDLTGKRFTKLVAISIAGVGSQDNTTWNCQCDCGETIVVGAAQLQNNNTKSCGCLKRERDKEHVAKMHQNKIDRGDAQLVKDLEFLGKNDVNELEYGDTRENGDRFLNRIKGRPSWLKPEVFRMNKIRSSIRSCVASALKRGDAPFKKNRPSEYLLCAKVDFVRDYIEAQFTPDMSWDNYGFDTWHYDHFIPMAYGKTQENAEILCHYSNLRPLPGPENLSKNDTLPDNVEEKFAILKEKVLKYRAENPKPESDSK